MSEGRFVWHLLEMPVCQRQGVKRPLDITCAGVQIRCQTGE